MQAVSLPAVMKSCFMILRSCLMVKVGVVVKASATLIWSLGIVNLKHLRNKFCNSEYGTKCDRGDGLMV